MSQIALLAGVLIAGMAFLAVLGAAIVVVIVRLLVKGAPPEEVLRERYARGDLTRAQYEQMRQDLGSTTISESSEGAVADPAPSRRGRMSDRTVRRCTGAFGLAIVALLLIEFPFRVALGVPPLLEDTARYADFVTRTSDSKLTIIVIDMFMMACILVFLAGFRHLIRQARADYEWVGTLVFGTGLVLVAVTLVADSMEGGTALDAVGSKADPTAIRALTEGYLLMFGSIGCILFALLSAATGYVTLATGVLPRWTGWFAYVVACLNLAAVPSIYGGTDPTGVYTAAGWGVAVIATFPWLIWALIVSIVMLMKPEAREPGAPAEDV